MSKTIVFPALPSGIAEFFDDIREEVTGKRTYIGKYGNYLLLDRIPSVVPKLMISVLFRESLTESDDSVIKVMFDPMDDPDSISPDNDKDFDTGKVLIEAPLSAPEIKSKGRKKGGFEMAEAYLEFQISPFHVTHPGRLKVRAYKGDTEYRLGALVVKEKKK